MCVLDIFKKCFNQELLLLSTLADVKVLIIFLTRNYNCLWTLLMISTHTNVGCVSWTKHTSHHNVDKFVILGTVFKIRKICTCLISSETVKFYAPGAPHAEWTTHLWSAKKSPKPFFTTFQEDKNWLLGDVPALNAKECCFTWLTLPVLPTEKYLIVISMTFWETAAFWTTAFFNRKKKC